MTPAASFAKLPTVPHPLGGPRPAVVAGIRCGKNHSGPDYLFQDGRHCECQGCLTLYPTAHVWAAIGKRGEKGGDRLYDSRVSGIEARI